MSTSECKPYASAQTPSTATGARSWSPSRRRTATATATATTNAASSPNPTTPVSASTWTGRSCGSDAGCARSSRSSLCASSKEAAPVPFSGWSRQARHASSHHDQRKFELALVSRSVPPESCSFAGFAKSFQLTAETSTSPATAAAAMPATARFPNARSPSATWRPASARENDDDRAAGKDGEPEDAAVVRAHAARHAVPCDAIERERDRGDDGRRDARDGEGDERLHAPAVDSEPRCDGKDGDGDPAARERQRDDDEPGICEHGAGGATTARRALRGQPEPQHDRNHTDQREHVPVSDRPAQPSDAAVIVDQAGEDLPGERNGA